MDIQDELQVSKFMNEWHKAAVNLAFTADWIDNELKEALKPLDVSPQQVNILRILRGQKGTPLSTLDIKKRMIQQTADVSRIVDRLYKKGLVEKQASAEDKRLVDITLTDKAKKLLEEIDKMSAMHTNFMIHLSESEAKDLNYILNKLRNKENDAPIERKRNFRAAKKGNRREY